MKQYFLRLDDACERMDSKKWHRVEILLDKYNIKPLVGVIPHCEDPMMEKYPIDDKFWDKVHSWIKKGWVIAMHGFNHVYSTNKGGINPVNKRSEFAGEPLEVQKEKIKKGVEIMKKHGINPRVFFAPSHTFDENTIIAIKEESEITIISDTIAYDSYFKDGIVFVPQQSGKLRRLPFKTTTICIHPNTMNDESFLLLERNINKMKISPFSIITTNRKKTIVDRFLSWAYFKKHKRND